jgi:hypothetical protein
VWAKVGPKWFNSLRQLQRAVAHARAGQRETALADLASARGQYFGPVEMVEGSCVLAACGRHDEAFAVLRQAVDAGYDHRPRLETDPDLAPLRARPEWRSLVERVPPF